MLSHVIKHGAKVFHVNKQQATLVGYTEHNVQHSLLDIAQSKQTGKQLRSHIGYCGTHGVPLLPEYVKETYRTFVKLRVLNTKFCTAFLNESIHSTRLAYAAQITLHIGHETGYTCLAECLGQHL